MIKAEHKVWARLLFNPYINRLLRKNFSHFYLVNKFPEVDSSKGLLITPNHFSWWDGFFIDYIMRQHTQRKLCIMMLEDQLKRYWFFKKLGAYSINPNNARSITESLQYTQEILKDPAHYVVYYPQGTIEPYDKRPVSIKPGLQRIFQNSDIDAVIVPVAFKIQYGETKLPAIFARFEKVMDRSSLENDFEHFKNVFRKNINELDREAHKNEYATNLFDN